MPSSVPAGLSLSCKHYTAALKQEWGQHWLRIYKRRRQINWLSMPSDRSSRMLSPSVQLSVQLQKRLHRCLRVALLHDAFTNQDGAAAGCRRWMTCGGKAQVRLSTWLLTSAAWPGKGPEGRNVHRPQSNHATNHAAARNPTSCVPRCSASPVT